MRASGARAVRSCSARTMKTTPSSAASARPARGRPNPPIPLLLREEGATGEPRSKASPLPAPACRGERGSGVRSTQYGGLITKPPYRNQRESDAMGSGRRDEPNHARMERADVLELASGGEDTGKCRSG